ncbi:MAG: 50S ribosomal protein L21 [Firmicutes bacterium]|nr:50S ribosomal protein L21 [Bacillota bacterium]
MYAIIECGGKQYRVSEGDRLRVEKLKAEVGATVMLDQVLLLGGEKTVIGTPVVDGAAVSCKVLRHDKEKKILVFRYKAKKNIRKRYGHRQPFTSLLVESIIPSGYVKPVVESAQAPVTGLMKAETTAAAVAGEPVKAKTPAPKASARKKEALEAAAMEPAVAVEKPVKKTAAKKTVTETETAAASGEKPAKRTRAKKAETPEA